MNSHLKLGVILASTRDGRRGEGFARWIHALLSERKGTEIELLDLRDWRLPSYEYAAMPLRSPRRATRIRRRAVGSRRLARLTATSSSPPSTATAIRAS